jgi:glycosyltransferase involved in cell wall biosynthesis
MKKIGIDARLYFQTGVGTYIRNLLYYLTREHTKGLLFYLYVLPQDIEKLPKLPSHFVIREAPCLWHSFSEQTRFLSIILQDKLDLMHFTYFGYPILYFKPFISTIHDITPLIYKTGKASTRSRIGYEIKMFVFKIVLYYQVRNSKVIITPSFTVKELLIQRFGKTLEKKISPIYEGIDIQLSESVPNPHLYEIISSPYLLYVGNFYPHKNIDRLIEAYLLTKSNLKLMLVGPLDYFTNRLKNKIDALHIKDKVIFFHNATASDLVYLYKNAKALIHPSLSEGFGLTIIEAVYFHCPVIASDIPIFHELMKNTITYFNPLDVQDIADKINEFIHEKHKDVFKRINFQMSFESMTKKTLTLYQRILSR